MSKRLSSGTFKLLTFPTLRLTASPTFYSAAESNDAFRSTMEGMKSALEKIKVDVGESISAERLRQELDDIKQCACPLLLSRRCADSTRLQRRLPNCCAATRSRPSSTRPLAPRWTC